MGTGYTRNDTSNNIANGNVIDADDFDGEFNAIQSAFNSSTGHTHDGTSAEGAPIEVTGPNQEYLSDGTALYPKADDTYDLGKTGAEWKDLYIDGVANVDTLTADAGTVGGSDVTTTDNTQTLTNKTVDSASNTLTVDLSEATVLGTLAEFNTALSDGTFVSLTGSETLTNKTLTSPDVNTPDIDGGTIDGAVIGGTTPAAISGTTVSASSGFTGNLTGDVTGDVTGNADTATTLTGLTSTVTELNALDGVDTSGTGFGFIPQGGIIMWSGSVASIPSGWAICDGTNSTPDLSGRFVVHADADSGGTYAPGDTGGSDSVTLTEAQLPAHTHGPGSLSTDNSGNHNHTVTDRSVDNKAGSGSVGILAYSSVKQQTRTTSNDGNHSHNVTSGSTGSVGSGSSHENRPPYYALAYIMKL